MSVYAKCIAAVLLLFGAATTASAQSYWYNGDYVLKQRGYYGTPYGGGPIWGSGGGDQYGYGPAYSYAKQAPEPLPSPPCVQASRLANFTNCRASTFVWMPRGLSPAI